LAYPGNRIHAIVNGTRDIAADTDLRLCKFFGLTDGYFLRLQNAYDTLEAKRRIASDLARIKRYKSDKAASRDERNATRARQSGDGGRIIRPRHRT
jgi:plasmid maintenance system antidote protein VapI